MTKISKSQMSGTFQSSLDQGVLAEAEAIKLLKKIKFNGATIDKIAFAKYYGIWDDD